MTAVVGILNKHAIAIAADSAVTITTGKSKKIFNQTNKIYTLSKFHPVGIMLYNSGSFLSTPWELIIKVYRKQLGDKFFNTLKEYQEDFINFLKQKDFFSDTKTQKKYLKIFITTIVENIYRVALEDEKSSIKVSSSENKEKAIKLIEGLIDQYISSFESKDDFFEEFKDYSFKEFTSFSEDIFSDIINIHFTNNDLTLEKGFIDKLKNVCYLILKCKEQWSDYTGITIVGYGESEIYPSLIPVNIYLAIEKRLRYLIEDSKGVKISNDRQSAIVPFAQTDVIDTILSGIDPNLSRIYTKNMEGALANYSKAILKIVDKNVELKTQIEGVDPKTIIDELKKKILETQRKTYITPLISALASLGKEDLAEMAESLIYLTYLKRRITFAEESVGGPVDVAIISKGDGFIWIKRKLYFKPELNHSFFDNYLK